MLRRVLLLCLPVLCLLGGRWWFVSLAWARACDCVLMWGAGLAIVSLSEALYQVGREGCCGGACGACMVVVILLRRSKRGLAAGLLAPQSV